MKTLQQSETETEILLQGKNMAKLLAAVTMITCPDEHRCLRAWKYGMAELRMMTQIQVLAIEQDAQDMHDEMQSTIDTITAFEEEGTEKAAEGNGMAVEAIADEHQGAGEDEKDLVEPAEWFYSIDGGSKQGPITVSELLGQQFTSSSLVWRDGMEQWLKAADLEAVLEQETVAAAQRRNKADGTTVEAVEDITEE